MIKFYTAEEIAGNALLHDTMFQDRAEQFRNRKKWDVSVDEQGMEQDVYDYENPIYAVWIATDGSHGGSMRLMPTEGKTMLNDHFKHVIGGAEIKDEDTWECTRFLISPRLDKDKSRTAKGLMAAGCLFGLANGITSWIGVYYSSMARVYQKIGWQPIVLGTFDSPEGKICVGMWHISWKLGNRLLSEAAIEMPAIPRIVSPTPPPSCRW